MFPYKVYYHQDGFEDQCIAQFAFEDDAEDWAIAQTDLPHYPKNSDYYVKKEE